MVIEYYNQGRATSKYWMIAVSKDSWEAIRRDEGLLTYTISPTDNMLSDIVAKVIREELEEPLDWSKLYSLSWLYALARTMHLQEDELYRNLKNIVSALLGDEKRFRIAIYDHEGAAGILFSLYHIADKEKVSNQVFTKVLETAKKLRWHEFDGEIMAFSYMLASKVGAKEYVNDLSKFIDDRLRHWLEYLDYESQRNTIYILFGFAYILDEKLADIVKEFKLYSINSDLLREITNTHDIEPIALILYVLGRIAYSRKLRRSVEKKVGKNAIKIIRYKAIPSIGSILTRRISEAGILVDTKSLPPDLLAKIQLARIESGLDKPFTLSKYEWKIYQEVSKAFRHGYYRVRRRDLIIGLILNAALLLPSLVVVLAPILPSALEITSNMLKHPYYELVKWLSLVILNMLYGIDISLYRHGSIKKEYLLGVIKHIMDLPRLVKKG